VIKIKLVEVQTNFTDSDEEVFNHFVRFLVHTGNKKKNKDISIINLVNRH